MSRLSVNVIPVWMFSACVGYLIGDVREAVWGLTISLGLTVVLIFVPHKG